LVGHVANANFFFCSEAIDAPFPSKTNAETLTTKADVLKALLDSLKYCDTIYQEITDSNFGERANVAGLGNKPTQTTRGAVLMFNTTHNDEHYRNLVVYLRLKGRPAFYGTGSSQQALNSAEELATYRALSPAL
jgi:hypothetical protein